MLRQHDVRAERFQQDRRQVAVDAERYFWVARLERLRDDLGRAGARAMERRPSDEAAEALLDAAALLDALIRQRTTP